MASRRYHLEIGPEHGNILVEEGCVTAVSVPGLSHLEDKPLTSVIVWIKQKNGKIEEVRDDF